ncbi:hypothetical protein MYCTH_2130158 [Thermothelomyces thermophilus ATCC 42464]|uniref:Uncharacterized protein n=1 Tax=Thermothelomyces thermophilus (strain ATCC 42464 / BCRC 31852 / DSM 1799) TaxID=573729 RepID=G2QM36_THET4|nr:uncharacterized protein MYCTH_2130158 [Thermothelomyces thermophilus ATCC 42464]AEO61016.1 hypothetical protein MYCTH_2130158 [Thermothelomyces thermophilus ATCC 42464]
MGRARANKPYLEERRSAVCAEQEYVARSAAASAASPPPFTIPTPSTSVSTSACQRALLLAPAPELLCRYVYAEPPARLRRTDSELQLPTSSYSLITPTPLPPTTSAVPPPPLPAASFVIPPSPYVAPPTAKWATTTAAI